MPEIIVPPTQGAEFVTGPRVRWKIAQYENLFAMGLLQPGKYELLDGDIVHKMPIKFPHAHVITRLFAVLSGFFGFPLLLSQFSLWISDDTLPEPDFAVLTSAEPPLTERGHVPAEAVRLVVEVSDATLAEDLTTKARLYARAGIPEYWVIDVTGRRLLIHDTPEAEGYAHVVSYAENDTAAPTIAPTALFTVSALLP